MQLRLRPRNPLRVLVGYLTIVLAFSLWSTAAIIARFLCLPRKFNAWIIDACVAANIWALELEVIVEGREFYREDEKCIVISNHSSYVDIPIIYVATGNRLRMIGKQELFYIPLMGWGMWAIKHVAVKRSSRNSAAKAKELLASRLDEGYQIYLAPEGTRSATGCLLPFKSGAFRIASEQRVPICVLALYEPWKIMPKGSIFNPKKGEVLAKFLGKIDPMTFAGAVKSPEELLNEARSLYLSNGFREC